METWSGKVCAPDSLGTVPIFLGSFVIDYDGETDVRNWPLILNIAIAVAFYGSAQAPPFTWDEHVALAALLCAPLGALSLVVGWKRMSRRGRIYCSVAVGLMVPWIFFALLALATVSGPWG